MKVGLVRKGLVLRALKVACKVGAVSHFGLPGSCMSIHRSMEPAISSRCRSSNGQSM